MRGGKGGVNYMSGSLARAKAKSKLKNQSPHRIKVKPNHALFPQKTLILDSLPTTTPPRLSGISLSQAQSPVGSPESKAKREPKPSQAQLEQSGYSLAAMPQSPRTRRKVEKDARRWWEKVDTVHPDGRKYAVEMNKKIGKRVEQGAGQERAREHADLVRGMLERDDFLEIPQWYRPQRIHPALYDDGQEGVKAESR